MSTLATSLFTLLLAAPVPPYGIDAYSLEAPYEESVESWQAEEGDALLVDTQNNVAYMVHHDGRYLPFPVATGQNRFVYYIGRYYHAATPNTEWDAKSLHVKGDRITYGPSGQFLRLYKGGEEYTSYGIHTYAYEDRMLPPESDDRFGSMGCVIVPQSLMDMILETWEISGKSLHVVTQYGVDNLPLAFQNLHKQSSHFAYIDQK